MTADPDAAHAEEAYEPPRIAVLGSVDEVTRGVPGSSTADMESFVSPTACARAQ
jgi:hypothetical protein